MEKIIDSVYRYDGKLESNEKPLVLVHPWYDEKANLFNVFVDGYEGFPRYISPENSYKDNLAKLLQESSNRNIFLFEEESLSEESCERVHHLTGKSQGIYSIPTKRDSPYLVNDIPFDNAMKFIGKFSKNIDIAGGRVNKEPRDPLDTCDYWECAGTIYEEFKERNFNPAFVEGCCFTDTPSNPTIILTQSVPKIIPLETNQ